MSVFALASSMWFSAAIHGSTDSTENAGYQLVGGFELWESATLHGGDFELTGHIEPAWEGCQQGDEQACDEGSAAETAADLLGPHTAHMVGSSRWTAPDADAIIELVQMWGVCPTAACAPDLTGDGLVETGDLMQLLFSGEMGQGGGLFPAERVKQPVESKP